MTLKGDTIFKEKPTDGLKNGIRNLVNFHRSSWALMRSFCQKYKKFLLKKKSYLSPS